MVTTTSYVSLFHATVDLTNIDTIHYMLVGGTQSGDLRFDFGGTQDDKAFTNGTNNKGTSDASGYTGEVELKIQIKTDANSSVTDMVIWGVAT